jgi:hypothetical protein
MIHIGASLALTAEQLCYPYDNSREQTMWVAVTLGVSTAMIISAVVRAYVIAKLWSWYVVSAFNVPEITMATAFGFSLLAGLFLTPPTTPKTEGKDTATLIGEMVGAFIGVLISYAFTLIVGAVVHDMASSP